MARNTYPVYEFRLYIPGAKSAVYYYKTNRWLEKRLMHLAQYTTLTHAILCWTKYTPAGATYGHVTIDFKRQHMGPKSFGYAVRQEPDTPLVGIPATHPRRQHVKFTGRTRNVDRNHARSLR